MDHPRWRIQELYAGASEQPESERSRFLSVACEGDEALEREVKTRLDQPTSTAQFVEFVGGPLRLAASMTMATISVGGSSVVTRSCRFSAEEAWTSEMRRQAKFFASGDPRRRRASM